MRILMLTSSFPRYEGDFSGPWILEYCRELVRQGNKVCVLAPGVCGITSDALSEPGLDIVRFRYSRFDRLQALAQPPGMIPNLKAAPWRFLQLPIFLSSFERAIKSCLKSADFDVIHSQWAIPAGWLGGRAARRSAIPHVITSQGAEFFLSTHHPFSWFTRRALATADCLFPVSEQMAQRARRYGANPDRMTVVPNAVNTNVFRPDAATAFRQSNGISMQRPIVLTVRRLVHEKRVEDLLDAFAALTDRRDALLVIGGDGPERHALEQRCRRLGIESDVRFIGFVDNADLPPIYAAADVYILSSQQEGLSLSLLEAMATGLAVITTACTGGSEVVEHRRNGYVYEVGDIKSLARLLPAALELAGCPESALRLAARRTIIDDYSVHSMVEAWSRVYRTLAVDPKV